MPTASSRRIARGPRVRRRNASRRWCIPPAILREPEETLEGSQVLEEHPGDLGLLLWNSLRDVTLWANVPPERREGLFVPDAAQKRLGALAGSPVEPTLEVSLTTLAAVVGSPAAASGEIVSLVCLQVGEWAERRGTLATALLFAQAAALSSPEDAAPAYTVGRIALKWGRLPRAETWLRRSIGLARRGRDWQSYAQAYVDLGTLYARRDQPAAARRYFTQAMRAGRRHGLLGIRGTALHGLFLLTMEAGELDEAERFAKAAMRAYGRGHARLPELMHDVAYLWVGRESYARAIPMLQKLLVQRVEPAERMFTLSVLARAAAGCGQRRLYEEAWSGAWSLLQRPAAPEDGSRTVLELARAASRLRDWPRLDQATRQHGLLPQRQVDRRVAEQLAELAALARTGRVA
ncbi:MAG TPA: tetratricopeptide repeat protein [Longimicrobium sp.]|nr:tetratricopeptide repeat protein [Longimicrobium sp.]